MHVVFISNSNGRAASRVRAILDGYAVRIGEAAWSSPMTGEALDEVHRALKRGISRHTSVACYRNRGRDALDLLWVVGNRNRYDSYGRFAPETRSRKKEFPMPFRHAALVAGIAGLCHDIGKSNSQFQHKIGNSDEPCASGHESDGIRHEWVSSWVFRRMLADEGQPLPYAMAQWKDAVDTAIHTDWLPVQDRIDDAVDAVTTLIATHHHAFGYGGEARRDLLDVISKDIHVRAPTDHQRSRLGVINIPKEDPSWTAHGREIISELDRLAGVHEGDPDYWHGITLIARAAMILADHEVSSLDKSKDGIRHEPRLYANTTKVNGKSVLNQDLIWHLQNVGATAKRNVGMFANPDLPALADETIKNIMQRSADARYAWQDTSCDALPKGPALVFNVASTGAGKTRSNVKIVCALRDGKEVRIASAFNLRALTLQTYDAYCDEIKLARDRECACLVGDAVIREIHESLRDDTENDADHSGSESNLDVTGVDALDIPEWLNRESARLSGRDPARGYTLKKMLAAPVLVSTIDFLNAAGDMTLPNADHAHALLRIARSDLILDELDSYDVDSMVAVLRLVHVAALFGRNVVISSATLSPALAEYAHRAYRSGMRAHRALFGASIKAHVAVVSDAAHVDPVVLDVDEEAFDAAYQGYMSRMAGARRAITKMFRVADAGNSVGSFHAAILQSADALHQAHGWDMDGTKVSVGLVRVANIRTCFNVAERLIDDPRIHVVTYHAREPLLRRTYKERWFDRILKRKAGSERLATVMRDHLKKVGTQQRDAIFIVVATPVEEVGRDHDFDWGIIEPSSMHSIIQTGGRVNRHRRVDVECANIVILNRCYRDVRQKSRAGCVFTLPGNEIRIRNKTSHDSHEASALLGVAFGEELPLDVSLMFGANKTPFARFDEDSVRHRLKDIVSERLESNGDLAWFGKWFAAAYPLRERSNTQIFSVLPKDSRSLRFLWYGLSQIARKGGRLGWQWKEQYGGDECEIPRQAWLSPTIHEVAIEMGALLGRNLTERDMSFQIYEGQVCSFDWRGIAVE